MTSNTRVPKAEITGVYGAVLKRFTRKMFGEVPEALGVMWHNRPVLKFSLGLGRCLHAETSRRGGDMTGNTRVPKAEITGVYGAVLKRFSRKMFGEVPDALGVMWHHRPVLKASMGYGQRLRKWKECDEGLKTFAHMAVASLVGCSWCLDFNYFLAHNEGLDEAKAREVPRWRESNVFTPPERDVMEYAEAMSQTPPTVTDELSARLLEQLGAAGLLELTAVVAFANQTTRANIALGIESQEFAAACGLAPLAQPSGEPSGLASPA